MNRNQKRSLCCLLIWGIVIIIFIPVFFMRGGAETWALDRPRFIISAAVFAVGYISFFTMLVLTRNKKSGDIERDERDMLISRRSSEMTLPIVMGYIFFTCITLYTLYEKANNVPAGWMWFIGYTCIFTGYIANSAISLILYKSKSSAL